LGYGKGNELHRSASEGRCDAIEYDPDLATIVLAEAGVEVGESCVEPNKKAILKSEGGGDGASSGVSVEGLIGDTEVGGDEVASAAEGPVSEVEGRCQGAVSGVDGSSCADETAADCELANLVGSTPERGGSVDTDDTEDELVASRRLSRNSGL